MSRQFYRPLPIIRTLYYRSYLFVLFEFSSSTGYVRGARRGVHVLLYFSLTTLNVPSLLLLSPLFQEPTSHHTSHFLLEFKGTPRLTLEHLCEIGRVFICSLQK